MKTRKHKENKGHSLLTMAAISGNKSLSPMMKWLILDEEVEAPVAKCKGKGKKKK